MFPSDDVSAKGSLLKSLSRQAQRIRSSWRGNKKARLRQE